MANHTQQLLNTWFEHRDELDWILATIIETDGSSYRKPGAMMMINSLGKYHGLLSGGCLESDIMRQSRQCWVSGKNRIIQYDMREEEDIAWQLGIGCGGMVRILLQPVNSKNEYLHLVALREQINDGVTCKYKQTLVEDTPNNILLSIDNNDEQTSTLTNSSVFFEHLITPSLKLAIFGGGIDAIPLAKIAATLAWQVTVVDPRAGYARQVQFPDAKHIVKASLNDISQHPWLGNIDAIVIMTHNVELDAQSLKLAQQSSAQYVGMLGPIHRTNRVLKAGKLSTPLPKPLANPIGLRLGGELPESIALSILSEIHAFMEKTDARSLSNLL